MDLWVFFEKNHQPITDHEILSYYLRHVNFIENFVYQKTRENDQNIAFSSQNLCCPTSERRNPHETVPKVNIMLRSTDLKTGSTNSHTDILIRKILSKA